MSEIERYYKPENSCIHAGDYYVDSSGDSYCSDCNELMEQAPTPFSEVEEYDRYIETKIVDTLSKMEGLG